MNLSVEYGLEKVNIGFESGNDRGCVYYVNVQEAKIMTELLNCLQIFCIIQELDKL